MKFINFLIVFLITILPILSVVSSAPTLGRNYFIASGRKSIILNTTESDNPGPRYYTATFVDTINTISDIYYATTQINAQTSSSSYPGSGNIKFIWYEIDTVNSSNTHLTTSIIGYFQTPYISYFTYSYLLILANNPLVGPYITIRELVYSPAVGAIFVPFPTTYQTGDSIGFSSIIKQIKKIYTNSELASNDYAEYVGMTVYDFTSTLRYRFDIQLPSYLISGANYSITYIGFILDRTSLLRDHKRSRLSAVTYLRIGGSSISVSSSLSIFDADFNMFMGIGKYYFFNYQQPSFKVSITYTLSSFTATFYGSLTRNTLSSLYFAYSYVYFGEFGCQTPYFIYNQSLNLCYSDCTNASEYYNQSTNTCQPCQAYCQTCNSEQSCTTCKNGTNRHLVDYKCVPMDGYYESNSSVPAQCNTSLCATCFGTANNCTKCISTTQMLINNTCVTCNLLVEGCSTCNQTACFACNSSYSFVNSSYCNLPCASSVCRVCSNLNTSECYQCKSGYVLQSGLCVTLPVCGDLIINSTEQCDDGNTVNRDGCDSVCAEEQYYQCYSVPTAFGYSYTLYCAYLHPVDLTLISIEKLSYSNSVRLIVSIAQYLEAFWSTKASLAHFLVTSPVAYRDMRVQFIEKTSSSKLALKLAPSLTSKHPQRSLLSVTFEYLQPIHGQSVSLGFNFSQSWDYALKQIPASSISLTLEPGNGHYAELYSSAVYTTQKQLENLFIFLSIAALLLFVLGFFVGCKRIASEMLMVFQTAYFGLLTLPALTPLFSALVSLSHSTNGYNILYSAELRPFEDSLASRSLKAAGLYSQFLFNLNTGALFVLLPIIIGLLLMLVAKAKRFDSDEARMKVQRAGEAAVGGHAYAGLVFAGCVTGVAAVLQVKYGMAETGSMVGMMSLVAAAVMLALYPIYGFARVMKREAFEEYNNVLVRDLRASLVFQVAYFYLGLISAAILCLCPQSMANCLVCVLPFAFFVATLYRPLFRKPMDKYRSQLNLLSIIFAQIPFMLAHWQGMSNSNNSDDLVLMAPVFVGLVLFVNFTCNLGFIIYELYKKFREKLHSGDTAAKEEPEEISAFNNINHFARPMLNSFIEYTDRELQEMHLVKGRAASQSPNSKSNLFLSSLKRGIQEKIRPMKVIQQQQQQIELGTI